MRRLAPGLFLLALLAGCDKLDMYTQHYFKWWDRSSFFANGSSMRHPVAGTVARDAPNGPVAQPAAIDAAMLERGHQRFDIFCAPCHGNSGHGEGMIVQRGFPTPPSLVDGELRTAKASRFYHAITSGQGQMYSYATRVTPADRWAIIAYIRALQQSQDAKVASLPQQDRAQLEALK